MPLTSAVLRRQLSVRSLYSLLAILVLLLTLCVSGASAAARLVGRDAKAGEAKQDVSLVLSGADGITDRSPANLTAVVTNDSERAVVVEVRADAGNNHVRVARSTAGARAVETGKSVSVKMAPHTSELVFIEVRTQKPVRRGKAALVVIATVRPAAAATTKPKAPTAKPTPPSSDPVVTRELNVELAGSDLLVLGIGSALIVPGLLAVWAALQVWVHDRRQLGLHPNAASIIWANKLWLLGAAFVSILAVWAYATLFGQADLLDTYTWRDLVLVSVGSAIAAAVLSALVVAVYRFRKHRITGSSRPWDVLRAAAQYDGALFERPVYATSDDPARLGLLVHRDGEAVVLTPPIRFSGPDSLVAIYGKEKPDRHLQDAVRVIKRSKPAETFEASFLDDPADRWVSGPTVVVDPHPFARPPESILKFDSGPIGQ
ncbi:hypothetical protein OG592_43530 (plasmid) [Streptomyces avidinii]|uniref:hypothetical protein n=1 Tax=Streptomyces avidinii TaxID=1895 RepID=UPI002F91BD13|nr:hypothetical protein OG592_43530 [Streptomyces avidinii]